VKQEDIAEALERAVIAHCREAGIADAVVKVSAGDGLQQRGYVAAVSPSARHCFEALFTRIFDARPVMVESRYILEERDAFDLARLEPYYSPPSTWYNDALSAGHDNGRHHAEAQYLQEDSRSLSAERQR